MSVVVCCLSSRTTDCTVAPCLDDVLVRHRLSVRPSTLSSPTVHGPCQPPQSLSGVIFRNRPPSRQLRSNRRPSRGSAVEHWPTSRVVPVDVSCASQTDGTITSRPHTATDPGADPAGGVTVTAPAPGQLIDICVVTVRLTLIALF